MPLSQRWFSQARIVLCAPDVLNPNFPKFKKLDWIICDSWGIEFKLLPLSKKEKKKKPRKEEKMKGKQRRENQKVTKTVSATRNLWSHFDRLTYATGTKPPWNLNGQKEHRCISFSYLFLVWKRRVLGSSSLFTASSQWNARFPVVGAVKQRWEMLPLWKSPPMLTMVFLIVYGQR